MNDDAAADDELYEMLDQLEEFTNRVGHCLEVASAANNRDAGRRHCQYPKPGLRYRLQ